MVKTYDLLVVGAGYWGAAVAFEAKRRGWSVAVIDDGDPRSGSRNASGICDPRAYHSSVFAKYWPPNWQPSDLTESLAWLVDRGGYRVREYFWNRFAGTAPRTGAECVYVADPTTLTRSAYPRLNKGVRDVPHRRLLVAAGYRTDDVLASLGLPTLGVRPLPGRGIIASGTPSTPLPSSVMIKPYVKHTVRSWAGGFWKVGDTAEQEFKDSRLEALRDVGRACLKDYVEVRVNEGVRPVLDRFTVEKLMPRVVVATGGGRLGLGVAGLVAEKVLEAFR